VTERVGGHRRALAISRTDCRRASARRRQPGVGVERRERPDRAQENAIGWASSAEALDELLHVLREAWCGAYPRRPRLRLRPGRQLPEEGR